MTEMLQHHSQCSSNSIHHLQLVNSNYNFKSQSPSSSIIVVKRNQPSLKKKRPTSMGNMGEMLHNHHHNDHIRSDNQIDHLDHHQQSFNRNHYTSHQSMLFGIIVAILILAPFSNAAVDAGDGGHGVLDPKLFLDYDDELNAVVAAAASEANLEEKKLPKCQDHKSICGFMQLNSAGLNKVPICSCKDNDCRLWLNVFDGRIIKHGNDFYKFCGPKPELLPCSNNQVAYVSFGKTDIKTGEKIAAVEEMKCLCQNDHILKTNRSMFEMTDDAYIYGSEQICQKAPKCSRKQYCLSITETSESTIERRHCRCLPGKYCPKDFRLAHEEVKEDRGTLFNMRCI